MAPLHTGPYIYGGGLLPVNVWMPSELFDWMGGNFEEGDFDIANHQKIAAGFFVEGLTVYGKAFEITMHLDLRFEKRHSQMGCYCREYRNGLELISK